MSNPNCWVSKGGPFEVVIKDRSYLNCKLYEGEWSNNLKNGEGREYINCNHLIFKGQYQENLKNGFGILYSNINNNIIYNGDWKNDEKIILLTIDVKQ